MFQKIKDYFSSIDNYVQKGVSHDFAFINHSSFDGDTGYMSEVQKNPVANRCIDLLSRSVGSIPISVIDGENSTIADLIRKSLQVPNYDEDISIFLQKIVIGMMIDGSVYVLALNNEDASRVHLYVLNKRSVTVLKNEKGQKIGYSYKTSTGYREAMIDDFGRCDLFEISYCCPFGVSPCGSIARSAKLYNSMVIKNQSVIDNSAVFSGFFVLREQKNSNRTFTDQDLKNMRAQIEKKVGEKNAGYAPILPPGMEWEQIKYTGDEHDSSNMQSYVAMEIMQAFGVPSIMLENGRRNSAYSSNYKEARLHFWEDTILPLFKTITSVLEHFFRNRYLDTGICIEPDLSKIPIFNDKNIDRMLALDRVGFLSKEEKRDLSGLVQEELNEVSKGIFDGDLEKKRVGNDEKTLSIANEEHR